MTVFTLPPPHKFVPFADPKHWQGQCAKCLLVKDFADVHTVDKPNTH